MVILPSPQAPGTRSRRMERVHGAVLGRSRTELRGSRRPDGRNLTPALSGSPDHERVAGIAASSPGRLGKARSPRTSGFWSVIGDQRTDRAELIDGSGAAGAGEFHQLFH